MTCPKPPLLLVHLGYPKSASTWLQHAVFTNDSIGFGSPWGAVADIAISAFAISNDYAFDPAYWRRTLDQRARRCTAPVAVMSNETLILDPCAEKYWGRTVCEKIARTFPDAYILLCVRRQEDLILSAYKEYVKNGGAEQLGTFVGAIELPAGIGAVCQWDYLQYHLAVEHLYQLFGQERVLVLPMERLRSDVHGFVGAIGAHVGLVVQDVPSLRPSNVGYQGLTIRFGRWMNSWCPRRPKLWRGSKLERSRKRILRSFDRLVPDRVHERAAKSLEAIVAEFVHGRFVSSNRQLEGLIQSDLGQFGYQV